MRRPLAHLRERRSGAGDHESDMVTRSGPRTDPVWHQRYGRVNQLVPSRPVPSRPVPDAVRAWGGDLDQLIVVEKIVVGAARGGAPRSCCVAAEPAGAR